MEIFFNSKLQIIVKNVKEITQDIKTSISFLSPSKYHLFVHIFGHFNLFSLNINSYD